MRLIFRSTVFLVLGLAWFQSSAQNPTQLSIESCDPGLKVVRKGDAFAIYVDEPWTVGANGFIGGMANRKIKLLLEHGYSLDKEIHTTLWHSQVLQLYALDDNTVFTSTGGSWGGKGNKEWQFFPRVTCLYSLTNADFCVTNDVYAWSRNRYGLNSNEVFIGKVETNIFYWKTEDARTVFYRAPSANTPFGSWKLPHRVIEISGVSKGLEKDIIFTVFQNTPGLFHWYPREWGTIEKSIRAKHK